MNEGVGCALTATVPSGSRSLGPATATSGFSRRYETSASTVAGGTTQSGLTSSTTSPADRVRPCHGRRKATVLAVGNQVDTEKALSDSICCLRVVDDDDVEPGLEERLEACVDERRGTVSDDNRVCHHVMLREHGR